MAITNWVATVVPSAAFSITKSVPANPTLPVSVGSVPALPTWLNAQFTASGLVLSGTATEDPFEAEYLLTLTGAVTEQVALRIKVSGAVPTPSTPSPAGVGGLVRYDWHSWASEDVNPPLPAMTGSAVPAPTITGAVQTDVGTIAVSITGQPGAGVTVTLTPGGSSASSTFPASGAATVVISGLADGTYSPTATQIVSGTSSLPTAGATFSVVPWAGSFSDVVVTGALPVAPQSAVWGSNPYTTDSNLEQAAVHAGLIAVGQTATIRKTLVGTVSSYTSTTAHGITSNAYGAWPGMQLTLVAVTNPLQPRTPTASGQRVTAVVDLVPANAATSVDISLIDATTSAVLATGSFPVVSGVATGVFTGIAAGKTVKSRSQVPAQSAVTSTGSVTIRAITGLIQAAPP